MSLQTHPCDEDGVQLQQLRPKCEKCSPTVLHVGVIKVRGKYIVMEGPPESSGLAQRLNANIQAKALQMSPAAGQSKICHARSRRW